MIVFLYLMSLQDGAQNPLEQLHFLQGHWRAIEGDTVQEEWWTDGRGGIMFGVNRLVSKGKVAFFEYVRIEANKRGVEYVAMPSGQQPTRFLMIEMTEKRVVFENKSHDYPQRVIYESGGEDQLRARIEGEVNGVMKSSEWSWRRVR